MKAYLFLIVSSFAAAVSLGEKIAPSNTELSSSFERREYSLIVSRSDHRLRVLRMYPGYNLPEAPFLTDILQTALDSISEDGMFIVEIRGSSSEKAWTAEISKFPKLTALNWGAGSWWKN